MADALDVACPDCAAPAGQPCRTSNPRVPSTHTARTDSARLRSVEHGTCDLCHQPMVRGVPNVTTTGTDTEAWHPDPTHAAACPPLPDPARDWNAYAAATVGGIAPGRPGAQHFVPIDLDAQIDALHGPGAAAVLDAALADGSVFSDSSRDQLLCDGSCGDAAPHGLHTEPLGL